MEARLLRTLAQHRHPLSGQGEDLQARRSRRQLEPGDGGLTVEGIGGVLLQLRFAGQADPFPGQGQQPGSRRLAEALGEEEEIAEIDDTAGVEIKAGIAAAEGLGEEDEVGSRPRRLRRSRA